MISERAKARQCKRRPVQVVGQGTTGPVAVYTWQYLIRTLIIGRTQPYCGYGSIAAGNYGERYPRSQRVDSRQSPTRDYSAQRRIRKPRAFGQPGKIETLSALSKAIAAIPAPVIGITIGLVGSRTLGVHVRIVPDTM